MRYLLDTNVISEIRRPNCDAAVARWFATVPADHLYLSVLSLGEIRRGVERLRRRDPSQAAVFDAWLARLITSFADRLLSVDAAVADAWGVASAGDPVPVEDALIAATAIRHGMVVVTRNASHLIPTGARVLNPWDGA